MTRAAGVVQRRVWASALLPAGALLGFLAAGCAVSEPAVTFAAAAVILAISAAAGFVRRTVSPHALLGAFLLLTILRPLPSVRGDPFVVGRSVDALWLALALAIAVTSSRRAPGAGYVTVWAPGLWLIILTLITGLSTALGSLVPGKTIVLRDLFEMYRWPYYLLVLALASHARWSADQIDVHFIKPLLLGIYVETAITLLQLPQTGYLRSTLEYLYTLKYSSAGGAGVLRLHLNGTFANANFMGVALATLLPFVISAFAVAHDAHSRMVASGAIACNCGLILASGSRTGWVAALIAASLYFAYGAVAQRRLRVLRRQAGLPGYRGVAVIAAAGAALVLALVFPHLERFTTTLAELRSGGPMAVASLRTKYEDSVRFVAQAMATSPLFGLGPSKATDSYLGDNQYSVLLYRYGLFGTFCWLAFWARIYASALRALFRSLSFYQAALARAVLSAVPALLVAGATGAFFDSTQIATVVLLLIGIAYAATGKTLG